MRPRRPFLAPARARRCGLTRLRRLIVGFFAAIGLLAVLVVIAAAVLVWRLTPKEAALPQSILLTVDLTKGLADNAGKDRLLQLVTGAEPTLRDFLDGIEKATADPRVKGLVAYLGTDNLGLGLTQEVRDAIAAFRAKGKFVLGYADSFGEFGPGTRPYYLATVCDEIWLQPMGSVGLTGLYSLVPFLKGTLDRLGIAPEFDHREEYKTAANVLTETAMTAPQREEIDALLASMGGQIVDGIAQRRRLTPETVRQTIDRGPLLAAEARDAKLVDRLGYRDQALAAARRRAGSGAELVNLTRYLDRAGHPNRSGERIALIYGNGLIVRGGGSKDFLADSKEMGADAIGRAFRAAARDAKVRAILFRIDSPGGSVVASESIWRDVVYAKEHGKPVIVSMGDVAGSGGYYVAAPADKIVAEPATLTGSIGVLAGKFVITGLLDKIGVSTDSARLGANAAMFSPTAEFSPQAHARLEAFLDDTYKGFKQHVAAGRHMSPDAVEAVAKGRVWTGEEAKARGLVDALGGYDIALRLAKEAAHIPAGAAIELTVFPREKGTIELIFDRLLGEEPRIGAGAIGRALAAAGPLVERLAVLFDAPYVLLMPPLTAPR